MNQTGRILEEVKKAVCGKDHVLVWVLTVLLARGHVLLEDIPGVGATRRRALLTHFKSVANLASATPEELCEVEGIGKVQAKTIWEYYHQKPE